MAEREMGVATADPFRPGLLGRLPEAPRKVAVVRASRIGDLILAGPALRALRAALPGAEISLIALPLVRDLARRSPLVDRHIPFPGYPGIAEQFFDARRTARFFVAMQEERFDLAIQLHGSGSFSNTFTLLLGAGRTAGFVRPGDPPGRLDAALPFPGGIHEVRRLLSLAAFLGAPPRGEELEFPLLREDRAEAGALLAGAPGPLIGVHPFAREEGKRWPGGRFLDVAAELRRRSGGTIVLIGRGGVLPAGARDRDHVLDLTGRTALPVLGAVIERLSVLLTNDSGPAHIARALGTPTVTLFVDTDPARWGPHDGGPHRVLEARAGADAGGEAAVRAAEEVIREACGD